MNISIFGLGYVGAVCAGCLSARGHNVVVVDISPAKIDMINQGKSPIVEPGLEQLLQQAVQQGRLYGTTDVQRAVLDTELSLLCVGTPSKKNGDLDLVYMEAVCRQIGEALRDKPGFRLGGDSPTVHAATGIKIGFRDQQSLDAVAQKLSGFNGNTAAHAMPEQRAADQLQTVKQFHNNPRLLTGTVAKGVRLTAIAKARQVDQQNPLPGKSRIGHHA